MPGETHRRRQRMYPGWRLCAPYLLAWQLRVTDRVPQGSVLGPFLGPCPRDLTSLTRLLADDVAVYRTILSRLDQTQLQQNLIRLAEWHMASYPAKCTKMSQEARTFSKSSCLSKRSENVLKVKLPVTRTENVLKVKYVLAFSDRQPGTLLRMEGHVPF